jgi:hypothetical protein
MILYHRVITVGISKVYLVYALSGYVKPLVSDQRQQWGLGLVFCVEVIFYYLAFPLFSLMKKVEQKIKWKHSNTWVADQRQQVGLCHANDMFLR